jgi:hypothetical protein
VILHTPWQLRRCEHTPSGVVLTVRGWLLGKGMDPALLDEWCQQMGLDPAAPVQVLDQPATVHGADLRVGEAAQR